MKEHRTYEDRRDLHAAERGIGARAGVFLLEGAFHVANHASAAERALLDRGALLVATLVFDGRDAQRLGAGGSPRPPFVRPADLRPLPPRSAVPGPAGAPSRN